jgi:ABC-2 type transport system permease protein
MNGTIFMETLRRSWRQILYWGIGLGAYGLYASVIIPDTKMLKQYAEMIKSMPAVMIKMFGASDAAAIATPEGFLSFAYFSYALILLAVYAVTAGLNVTANEEDQGILDVVLSLPLPRWRVVLERTLAYAVIIIAIVTLAFAGLLIGVQSSALKVDPMKLLQSSANILPSALLILSFTVFCGTFFRRKGTATAVAAVFVIASYFINFIGESASGMAESLRVISFFHYYDASGVMQNGLAWGNVILLVALAAVLVGGAVWFFQRRDVGV